MVVRSLVVASDQAVMKRSYSIFLNLLGKLCVRVLSVKGFVKIVHFVFVYSGECVTTTTYR